MSIEPTCKYCNESTKFRCKTDEAARKCKPHLFEDLRIQMEKSENVKNLSNMSGNVCRSVIAIIDALAQRGSFKGEELFTIGQLREQCSQVIRLSEAVQSEENEGN